MDKEKRGFSARYHDHTEGKRGFAFTGAVSTFILLEVAKAAIGFLTFQFLKKWWDSRNKS